LGLHEYSSIFPIPHKETLKPNPLEEIWGYATILFVIICDNVTFATTFSAIYQHHQNFARFATILQLMCDYYLFHSLMWIFLKLYSSVNKPPWPLNWTCNQNLVTNWCTMCILGIISIHIWGCPIKNST